MNTAVHWVNPDTLRISDGEVTGLVRFEGRGIEVNVEIYDGIIPNTFGPYIQRAIQLFDSFPVITNSTEPDPEPSLIPDLLEPDPEYGIWSDFLPIEYSEFQ